MFIHAFALLSLVFEGVSFFMSYLFFHLIYLGNGSKKYLQNFAPDKSFISKHDP